MNCPNCNAPLFGDARFCSACGTPIVAESSDKGMPQTPFSAIPANGHATGSRRDQLRSDLRKARAAYVAARRAAGKSYAPRVVACVVAAAVVAGAVGGSVWYVMSQQIKGANARADELQAQVDDLRGQLNMPSVAQQAPTTTTGADAVADEASTELALDDASSLVGTWIGTLSETSGLAHCYGASDTPLEVTVKNVNPTTGQITLDVSVLFHGHSYVSSDAAATDGDRVVTFEDLTSMYSESGFTVRGDIEGTDDYVRISFTPEKFSYGVRLAANVESWHLSDNTVEFGKATDAYVLEKS